MMTRPASCPRPVSTTTHGSGREFTAVRVKVVRPAGVAKANADDLCCWFIWRGLRPLIFGVAIATTDLFAVLQALLEAVPGAGTGFVERRGWGRKFWSTALTQRITGWPRAVLPG